MMVQKQYGGKRFKVIRVMILAAVVVGVLLALVSETPCVAAPFRKSRILKEEKREIIGVVRERSRDPEGNLSEFTTGKVSKLEVYFEGQSDPTVHTLLELRGAPFQIGYVHGYLGAPYIIKYIEYIKTIDESGFSYSGIYDLLTPELQEEIDGMVAGVNYYFRDKDTGGQEDYHHQEIDDGENVQVTRDDIVMIQCEPEINSFSGAAVMTTGEKLAGAFSGKRLLSRSLDWLDNSYAGEIIENLSVITYIFTDDTGAETGSGKNQIRVVTVGKYGQLGVMTGLNESGLFVELNKAPVDMESTTFFPSMLYCRRILETVAGDTDAETVKYEVRQILEEEGVCPGVQVMVSGTDYSAVVEGIGVEAMPSVAFREPGWNEAPEGMFADDDYAPDDTGGDDSSRGMGAASDHHPHDGEIDDSIPLENRRSIQVCLVMKATEYGMVYGVTDGNWAGMMGRSEVLDQILGEPPEEKIAEVVGGGLAEIDDAIDQVTWEIRGFDSIPLFTVNPAFIRSQAKVVDLSGLGDIPFDPGEDPIDTDNSTIQDSANQDLVDFDSEDDQFEGGDGDTGEPGDGDTDDDDSGGTDDDPDEDEETTFDVPDLDDAFGGINSMIVGIKGFCRGNLLGALSWTGKGLGMAGPVILKVSNFGLWGPSQTFNLMKFKRVTKDMLDKLIRYDGLIAVGQAADGSFLSTFSTNPAAMDSQGFWASGTELLHQQDISHYGRLYLAGGVPAGGGFIPLSVPGVSLPVEAGLAGYRYVKDNSDFSLSSGITFGGGYSNFGDVVLFGICPPSVEYMASAGQTLSWFVCNPSFSDENLLVDVGSWYLMDAIEHADQPGCLGSPVDMYRLYKAYYYFMHNNGYYTLARQYDLHANMYLEGFKDFFIPPVGCTVYHMAACPEDKELLVGFATGGGSDAVDAYELEVHPVKYGWEDLFTMEKDTEEEVTDDLTGGDDGDTDDDVDSGDDVTPGDDEDPSEPDGEPSDGDEYTPHGDILHDDDVEAPGDDVPFGF